MQRHFITAALLGASFGFSAIPAAASCVTTASEVVCTGDTPDGFENDANDLNVTVDPGASLRNDADAVTVEGDNVTLTNNGVIDAGDDAIVGGDILFVTNAATGVITAADKGIEGAGLVVLENSGTITSVDKTLDNDQATILVSNFGLIRSSADEGLEGGDDSIIVNTGTIEALDDAIQIGLNGDIENFGRIANIGGAADDPQDAIDIDSGEIINHTGAEIISEFDAAIDFDEGPGSGIIDNRSGALISGHIAILTDPENTGAQQVTNAGSIIGTSGVSMDLGLGDDSVAFLGGGFDGDILLGGGDDVFELGFGRYDDYSGLFTVMGGSGDDTLAIEEYEFGDLVSLIRKGDGVFDINLEYTTVSTLLSFSDFETIKFADQSVSFVDIAPALAPIPLPAGVLLLGAAIAGLGAVRRRRVNAA